MLTGNGKCIPARYALRAAAAASDSFVKSFAMTDLIAFCIMPETTWLPMLVKTAAKD
jgi:hypothetical protein